MIDTLRSVASVEEILSLVNFLLVVASLDCLYG
jgi:hypothetical protein